MPALFAVPLAAMLVLLMVVTFPVSVPLITLASVLDDRRLRRAANRMRCIRCGVLLGHEALHAADAAFRAAQADLQWDHSHGIIDVFRRSHGTCTACGAEYAWDGGRRGLRLLPEDFSHEPGGTGCRIG